MSSPAVVGLAGGSASGKTSIARILASEIGEEHAALIELDSYYRDLGHLSFEERDRVNFDHPDAFDWPLFEEHLRQLVAGQSVDVPVYDYATHNRSATVRRVEPRAIVLVEGILVLHRPAIRDLMSVKVYVDTPDDVRLLRRIKRDTEERGRELRSVLEQYEDRVRPMHRNFCEPTKEHADVVIPRGARNRVAIEMVKSRLVGILHDQGPSASASA